MLEPSHFSLNVKGVLYSRKLGTKSRLKGKLEMSISFVQPPVLDFVPEDVRRGVAETVRPQLCHLLTIYTFMLMFH